LPARRAAHGVWPVPGAVAVFRCVINQPPRKETTL
jgi:hypothetical protein